MVQGKKKKAETWLANSKTMYSMKQDQRFKWMNDTLEIKNMYNNNIHEKKKKQNKTKQTFILD